jgi:hypothetical protein
MAYFYEWEGGGGGSHLGLFLTAQLGADAGRNDATMALKHDVGSYYPQDPGGAVDLDADGDMELTIRYTYEGVVLFEPVIGAGLVGLQESAMLTCEGWDSPAGPPALADLTGDGLIDVFNVRHYDSEDYHLYEAARRWFEGEPCWGVWPDVSLVGTELVGSDPDDHGSNGVVGPGDFDGDGLLDIAATREAFHAVDLLRTPFPLGPLTLEDYLTARWNTDDALVYPWDLSTDGDVDGDGEVDILAAADGNQHPDPEPYEAWFLGSRDIEPGDHGLSEATATLYYPSVGHEQLFRLDVGIVGDMDGDGFAEIAVNSGGSSMLSNPSPPALKVWFGPVCGEYAMETQADIAIVGEGWEQFGGAFDSADFTGDGYADLVVSAYDHLTDEGYSGKVYLLDALDILSAASSTTQAL